MDLPFSRKFIKCWTFLRILNLFALIIKILDLLFTHEFSKILIVLKLWILLHYSSKCWTFLKIADFFALIIKILDLFASYHSSKCWTILKIGDLLALIVKVLDEPFRIKSLNSLNLIEIKEVRSILGTVIFT